jgi:hypothetical protein
MDLASAIGNSSLHQVEDAITARLRLAFPEAKFAIMSLPSNPSKRDFEKLFERTPVLAICWTGVKTRPSTNARSLEAVSTWTVMAVVKNTAGAHARLRGDKIGPGIYGVTSVAASLLHGWTLTGHGSGSVTGISPMAISEWAPEGITPAGIDFEMPISVAAPYEADDTAAFLRLQSTWTFEPATGGSLTFETTQDQQS